MTILKKFIRDAQRVSLTREDRRTIRHALMALTHKETPVQMPVHVPWFAWLAHSRSLILAPRFALATACLVIVVMTGSGIALAAESTLPGDLLYPLKVNVTEELRTYLTRDTAARAAWETTRLERRLEEAETLAMRGTLDTQTSASLTMHIEKNTNRLQTLTQTLASRNDVASAATVNTRIEASLTAHEKILSEIRIEKTAGAAPLSVQVLVDHLEKKKKAIETRRKAEEQEIGAGVPAQAHAVVKKRKQKTKERIEEIRGRIEERKDVLGIRAAAKIEVQLDDAENRLERGLKKEEHEEFEKAFVLFQSADRVAQEADVLMKAHEQQRINLNVTPLEHIVESSENGNGNNGEQNEHETKTENDPDKENNNRGNRDDIPQPLLPVPPPLDQTLPIK